MSGCADLHARKNIPSHLNVQSGGCLWCYGTEAMVGVVGWRGAVAMEGAGERHIGVSWRVYACAYGVIGCLGRVRVLAMSKNHRFVRTVFDRARIAVLGSR